MEDVLIACGNIDVLRRIVGDLPPKRFKPIAAKKGSGVVEKLASRNVGFAIIHSDLADGKSNNLREQLKAHFPSIIILLLGSSEIDHFSDSAIQYPVPGPILRNAIKSVYPEQKEEDDLEKWRAFNKELNILLKRFESQNYYQILGLQNSAPHHALVSVYDELSARYHPDRYATISGTKWGDAITLKVTKIYQMIVEAYSILSHRQLKNRYDDNLIKGEIRMSAKVQADTGPKRLDSLTSNPQSKKFLRLAQSSIAKKDLPSALQNLRFAQSMDANPAIQNQIDKLEEKLKND